MRLNVENDNLVIELEQRSPLIENLIISQENPLVCLVYAKKVMKSRWGKAEEILLKNYNEHQNINYIWNYVNYVVRGRWPEAEPLIAESENGFDYAKSIVKGRWELGENYFLDNISKVNEYKKILDEAGVDNSTKISENAFIKSIEHKMLKSKLKINNANSNWYYTNAADELYRYCMDKRKRLPEAEYLLAQSNYSLIYCKEYIRERWPLLESNILQCEKNINIVVDYARNVIKGRWPEAESTILEGSVENIYSYIDRVVMGRWKEAEDIISKDPKFAYLYALNFIKGRWEEAEFYIANSFKYSYEYAKNIIKGRLPEVMHNIFMMKSTDLSKNHRDYEYVDKYFTYKKYKKEIKRRKPVIVNAKLGN